MRSSWGFQTGLAGAIFLLCISCGERELLENFPANYFLFFPLSGKCQFMKINKFPGNTLLFKIKYFHCAEEQKANGDDKVKECSDISFQACQLQHFILHKILNRGKKMSHELFKQENEFTVNLWSWKQGVLKITGLL